MIKEALYHKTVDILYQAYFNGTLLHGDCSACAVGNIIAANMGFEIRVVPCDSLNYSNEFMGEWWKNNAEFIPEWSAVHCLDELPNMENYEGDAKSEIDCTGYTPYQTAKIEMAFERAHNGRNDEDYMFNGLVAVLEVLKEIHEVADEDLLQSNRSRFESHYKTKSLIQSP